MSARADFWARRKAAVRAEQQAEERAVAQEAVRVERETLEEKSDQEILTELNLPDPDTLRRGDDVRGFMAQAVPERLRRRALRQLWKLNPVLANLDGLVDYDEDFNDPAFVVESIKTSYQVGKGMLAHIEELARQADEKAAKALGKSVDVPAEPTDEAVQDSVPAAMDAASDASALRAEHATPTDEGFHADSPRGNENQEKQSDTHFAAVSRRRMRFAFET